MLLIVWKLKMLLFAPKFCLSKSNGRIVRSASYASIDPFKNYKVPGVGQCGNHFSSRFWETAANEHGVQLDGSRECANLVGDKLCTYFNLNASGRYIPRSIFVDLHPEYLNSFLAGQSGRLHNMKNVIPGEYDPIRNWAAARYEYGPEVIENVMNVVRKETELCDRLQGFQLAHSLGGGTGSGLGSLIISQLREEYSEKVISAFSVVPSFKVCEFPIEPYHTAFTAHYLIHDVDASYLFDNETLCADLVSSGLDPKSSQTVKEAALTELIVPAMVGSTYGFRFPTHATPDLRSVVQDLVVIPKLHFLSVVVSKLPSPTTDSPWAGRVDFSAAPFLPHWEDVPVIDPRFVKYRACAATYRGNASVSDINDLFATFPTGARHTVSHCAAPAPDHSVTLVGNHSSMQYVWERIYAQYNTLYRRKAFMKIYMGTGMDEMECVEAWEDLCNLIEEYKQRQDDSKDTSIV